MQYRLHLRYIYTFYSFGEELAADTFDEYIELLPQTQRFTLHDQEDGSFVLSPLQKTNSEEYVILTYPNKDNLIIKPDNEYEIAYDEYYSATGDDNHNVYWGTMTLEVCK